MKLDTDTLRYIAALEGSAGVEVKDCIVDETTITYIVREGQLGKAIGKKGVNVKKIGTALGKHIRLVEYSKDPIKFTRNLLEVQPRNVTMEGEETKSTGRKIIVEAPDFRSRGVILGKDGNKIQILKDILKRHHNIKDVSVK
jgi:N utilization substance protein A